MDANGAAITASDPPMSEELPTLTGVREVIKLYGGKAASICGTSADLLNVGSETMEVGLLYWLQSGI